MTCPRCPTGFVIEERPFRFLHQRRCLICGYREDRTMAANRAALRPPSATLTARALADRLFRARPATAQAAN